MYPYNDFQLSSDDIEKIKDRNYRRALAEYIKTHGAQPDDETALSFRTASAEDIEAERRILYALRTQKPHDYSKDYLTFEITSDGYINWKSIRGFSSKTIEYSKNDGEWTKITSTNEDTHIDVVVGDIVRFRGNNSSYNPVGFSQTTCGFKLYGNIMSLIYGDNFIGQTAFPENSTNNFSDLFISCTGLADASNLILPATTLANSCYVKTFKNCTSLITAPELPATTLASSCYSWMFAGCTSLTTAPELPATTLVEGCYFMMFNNCSSLNYIKCLATNISANSCTSGWVNGVASSGTFVKNPEMNDWTTDSGIPEGWTIQDATE